MVYIFSLIRYVATLVFTTRQFYSNQSYVQFQIFFLHVKFVQKMHNFNIFQSMSQEEHYKIYQKSSSSTFFFNILLNFVGNNILLTSFTWFTLVWTKFWNIDHVSWIKINILMKQWLNECRTHICVWCIATLHEDCLFIKHLFTHHGQKSHNTVTDNT